ncbi:MAG: diphthine synthase [Thermoproteota archaeon]
MPLYLVGAGISSEYLSLRAIQLIGSADVVVIDAYTSIAPGVGEELVKALNSRARVVHAPRRMLEEEARGIIEEARSRNVVVLVPGDPLAATAHAALLVEALKAGVRAEVVPGVSGILASVTAIGLQVYRLGKVVTLVYPQEGFKPYSTVEAVWDTYRRNMHTLVLLDLKLEEGIAMTVPEAVRILLELEDELARREGAEPVVARAQMVGVARAGLPDQKCVYGDPDKVMGGRYPPPPHSLVVLAPRLHPLEEEALNLLCA